MGEDVTDMDSSKLDGLIERQQRRGIDIRPTLLRMLTDVYVSRPDHSVQERTDYVGFALKLIAEVDPATCATVARLLHGHPDAPGAVLDRLEERARVVPDAGIDAGNDPDIAPARRFFVASADERRSILAAFDTVDHGPPPARQPASDTILSLERSALAGHPGDFIRELERALELPRETAERIVNDLGGEPMVAAARALGMPLAVLQRVLMFLNPAVGHSVRRVYDLSALYEDVTPAAARRLVAAWSTAGTIDRVAPATAREYRDDGSLRAVATARPAEHAPQAMPQRRLQRSS
jgi:hypothetical protein